MPSDLIAALLELKDALDRTGIDYMVVGSLASTAHGRPRSTQDADLLVAITPQQGRELTALLQPRFYVPEEAAQDAIRRGTSFNVIHFRTFYKADLFVMSPTPFNKAQFERREHIDFDPEHNLVMPFQSAEDTILSKLDWFRQGKEVSERQWQDVLDILRAQGDQLDYEYMQPWAANLGVDELLHRAIEAYRPRNESKEESPF
jgi:hypothetical protein